MLGVFDRYVVRETTRAWAGITGVLVLVVVVNRFAVYLGQAAAGEIPAHGSFVLLGLSVAGLLEIVIPVSLFLAAMLTLGRLYRDGEATAAWTCGLTPVRLYRPFALLALVAALLLVWLALFVSPWAKASAHRVELQARSEAQVSVLVPGRFKEFSGDNGVFYVGGIAADGKTLTDVFAEMGEHGTPAVLTSSSGRLLSVPASGERHLQLVDGLRYAGVPGRLDWTITHFARSDLLIRPPQAAPPGIDLDRLPTAALLRRDDAPARAALEWRIAQPFTVLVLLLIAVPLAHTRPRQGRYARLVPAILVYLVYFNLLGVARVWVAQGRTAWLWWVPGLFAAGGLVLVWNRYGRHVNLFRRRHAD